MVGTNICDKTKLIYSAHIDTMIPWYAIGQYRTIPLEPLPIPAPLPRKLKPGEAETTSSPDAVYTRLYQSLPAHLRNPTPKVQPQTYPMGWRWRT